LVATQGRVAKGQKWIAPWRLKPELYIFNLTAACPCLSVVQVLEKRVDCWHWKRT